MLTVFYDGDCGFCLRCAQLLRQLDRGRRLRLVELHRAIRERPDAPTLQELHEEMHAVDLDGQWVRGAQAWLAIGDRVPLLRPLAVVGRLPLVRRWVDPVYRLVARNRHHLSRWLGGRVCRLDDRTA